jgi:8-oxo-dGTP diphosphatase
MRSTSRRQSAAKLQSYQPRNDEERSFLKSYREQKWPRPALTADVLAFARRDQHLSVLLIKRKNFPFQGCWAIPGGFVDVGDSFVNQGEDIDAAAVRELAEETGIHLKASAVEQLGIFGRPYRDPRTRIVTVVYLAVLTSSQAKRVCAGDDAAQAQWHALEDIDGLKLGFDHADIIAHARHHLHTRLAQGFARVLLTSHFTLMDMRALQQQLLGKDYDEMRFRREFRRQCADGVYTRCVQQTRGHYAFGG